MRRDFFKLMVMALLVTACSGGAKTEVEQEESLRSVKVTTLETQIVEQRVQFTGNIEPLAKNAISSAAAQRIEKVYVEVGDRVTKGQLLVKMEDINYTQTLIQLQNLRRDLARVEALYESGGASEQQYQQLKTQVDVLEESIVNIEQNTKLLSPINGVVTHRNFDGGDLAVGQPILVVMQISPVKILVSISEEFFPKVKIGTPVDIELDIYPESKFTGRVMLIHPTIDPFTRSFIAEVRIDNPGSKLRPGMYARSILKLGEAERVVIPDMAVIKRPGTNERYTFVLNGDRVEERVIQLGSRDGEYYEVLEGLDAGEQVVYAGHSYLLDNTKVKVVDGGVDLTQ